MSDEIQHIENLLEPAPVQAARSKWTILVTRLAELEAETEKARNYLKGMDATPCGIRCSGCDTMLATEGDFARHFHVPDDRLLNLGDCPVKGNKPVRSL